MKQPAQNVDDARVRVTLILFPGGMSMIKTSTTSRLVLLVVLLPWLQAGSGTGRSKLESFVSRALQGQQCCRWRCLAADARCQDFVGPTTGVHRNS